MEKIMGMTLIIDPSLKPGEWYLTIGSNMRGPMETEKDKIYTDYGRGYMAGKEEAERKRFAIDDISKQNFRIYAFRQMRAEVKEKIRGILPLLKSFGGEHRSDDQIIMALEEHFKDVLE